ncbi:MAG TPA: NADP-dependent malic enzyme [Anaerolineae bacterium]|nr:NADP-dependent malic enzyme [Anaerolineae bacterium]HMR63419.1 NADP-dependent malic enzyme [Anaerolineae bacterium]
MDLSKSNALRYHEEGRPGKIEVIATKPTSSQLDLSLAYSPGVAAPVLEIAANPNDAYRYTAKSNLVAVISNGTAILGLGDRGPLAAKPVMEGKGVLFKRFADIDVFDIEVDVTDPEEFIKVVRAIAPTFGGINLEDIKAPGCFVIEQRLKEMLDIPVFHDDQHGTAIIATAGLMNALEVMGKAIATVKIVVNGAGASAISCAELFILAGARRENITLVDSRGVIYAGRTEGMNEYKARFAKETEARTLTEALQGADVMIGLSVADSVTPEMIQGMAEQPIIFAMANPDPEIKYELARETRPDAIIATGRSDYPNQVNNVLGFPFIFRGALDAQARQINDEMKLAAAKSLAALAHEDVPDSVLKAYNLTALKFGPEYIIPKPFDPRVLLWVAPAVAEAAMRTGVARRQIELEAYRERLEASLGKGWQLMRHIINKARHQPKRVVFGEGDQTKTIRAAAIVQEEGIGHPILLGPADLIRQQIRDLGLDFDPEIIEPQTSPQYEKYSQALFELRQRKGMTLARARNHMRLKRYFGPMMVRQGDADAYLAGLVLNYLDVLRPALEIIGYAPNIHKVAGMYIIIVRDKVYFFVDATVNIDPTAEDLAEFARMAAREVRRFDIEPKVAMLSFSNFGSSRHPFAEKVRRAVEILHERHPDLQVDGEMMADTALLGNLVDEVYPFSRVREANILVFPDLAAANIAYKLMQRLGNAESIGPLLLGMDKVVHILQDAEAEVRNIVNMAAMAVIDAQER